MRVRRAPEPAADGDGFAAFWLAYPRHVGKAKAEKAWAVLKPNPELQATILLAIDVQRRTDQWTRDSGAYIPHPTTWLHGRRWEDEIATPQLHTRAAPPTTTARPTPTYPDDDWCQHDPRCNSREWHALTMQVPG
jgi:hypothetical protein